MQVEAAQQTEQRGTERRLIPFNPKRILLVDDDPLLLEPSREALIPYTRRKYDLLYAASSGIIAISILRTISADPTRSLTDIVTDLSMPYFDGIDVIQEAIELEFDRRFGTKFYIFSTNESEGRKAAAKVGAQFIHKQVLPLGKDNYTISPLAISKLYRALYGIELQRKAA